jgi:putative transcriptional regulator
LARRGRAERGLARSIRSSHDFDVHDLRIEIDRPLRYDGDDRPPMWWARLYAGHTQQTLAEELHVSRQTICTVETGRSIPSVRLALSIADALGKTVEELFALRE